MRLDGKSGVSTAAMSDIIKRHVFPLFNVLNLYTDQHGCSVPGVSHPAGRSADGAIQDPGGRLGDLC